jgi:16S rRNA (uracil1498-N3)-methyltransferase
MSRDRFFYPFRREETRIILDDADEFSHLARVLRLKPGDVVELVNGQGGLAAGLVREVGRSSALIAIDRIAETPHRTGPQLTIACAIPKKAKFETIVEKCTELGVDRIIPLLTSRTEVDPHGERVGNKQARYARVVVNAAKQCGRLWFPEMMPPVPFGEALGMVSGADRAVFFPWLEGERVSLARAFAARREAAEVVFFIGPEGDFTPQEAACALRAGAVAVTLGDNVLKVDTAAIAVAAFAVLNEFHS